VLNPTRTRSRARVAALVAAAGLLLAGCVAPKDQTTPPAPEEDGPPTEEPDVAGQGLEGFYGQDVKWEACDGGYECARIAAPLDWDVPETGSIQLSVKRALATGSAEQRLGSLLVNPGGPGASGKDFVVSMVDYVVSDEVRDAYDIVGFDPRGVGESSAVACGDDTLVDEFFTADIPMEDQADVEAARERLRTFGEACLESTGPLLGEVDTVSAARDMDLMRAVLGDTQLSYVGFSYGTFLGATYADLYPENVGRLVLDGALDPSMSNDDLVIGQAIGFENALRAYVEFCQSTSGCPLTGDVDSGMEQIRELTERAEADPIPAGGGMTVNGTLAFYGIVVTLYDDASWRYLTQALDEVVSSGTAGLLLELANFYLDRTSDGHYTANAMVAFSAINCLDYPMEVRDYDEIVAFAEQVGAQAPTFGRDFGMAIGCETWPFPATGAREPISATGAAPILVIGTTGDPATPYDWAVALADQLDSGTLLTWEGEGHTAYGRGGPCVDEVVEAYLLDGEVPAEGTRC
jgi:pimeloyl-ACP methyl ester carboxylesterase